MGELDDKERHLTNECLYVEETDSETETRQGEIEMLQEKVEEGRKEIVQTVLDEQMMLLEDVTEQVCRDIKRDL